MLNNISWFYRLVYPCTRYVIRKRFFRTNVCLLTCFIFCWQFFSEIYIQQVGWLMVFYLHEESGKMQGSNSLASSITRLIYKICFRFKSLNIWITSSITWEWKEADKWPNICTQTGLQRIFLRLLETRTNCQVPIDTHKSTST